MAYKLSGLPSYEYLRPVGLLLIKVSQSLYKIFHKNNCSVAGRQTGRQTEFRFYYKLFNH